jgi:hypothetical protein
LFRKKVAYRVPFGGVDIIISSKFGKLKINEVRGDGIEAMG